MSFEEAMPVINCELAKRKHRWTLNALAWMDFDDVSQIIRLHIYKKWKLYDQTRPLAPWVSRVISSQIKNLIRNNYGNFSRPCLKCAAAEEADGCKIYGSQCTSCPLYEHWTKHKEAAFNIRLSLPLENHELEVYNLADESINMDKPAEDLHKKMLQILKTIERKVYQLLFIDGLSDEEVAKIMKWKTNEAGRNVGYKSLGNIKKSIIEKAKKVLKNEEIDFYH